MPTFAYTARDSTNRVIKETAEASSKDALIQSLRERGLTVDSVEEQKAKALAKKKTSSFKLFGGKVSLKDFSMFCRQFATMINAGVSLVRCLDVLEQQTSSARLKEIIRDIQVEIQGGATLSRSMGKYPRVFSNLAVGLVRAGEVGGVLDETLDRLAEFSEKDMELRRKVKSAMTYPVMVMIVAVGIVVFLVTFILPKFMDLFLELGMTEDQFPGPTRLLMASSNFLTSKWWLAAIIIFGMVTAINRIKATKTGKRYYDLLILKVPVFGSLNHKIAVARFARTLATLLSSGVPILQAMETVAGTVDNDVIADAVLMSRASIREGDTIAAPLADSKMFPPMVVQMIAIGEETGQLDSMLTKVAEFYEGEVDAALESLTAALEPVLIVFLGVVVGFIVISMFLPLVGIIGELSQ
ncbi:MAG: type II secretion system F family protein [candidate division WS1 bacterium]|nr:type II secretion system F family protein [candidate division WS1 bacterium]